jgi:hypothetical protein
MNNPTSTLMAPPLLFAGLAICASAGAGEAIPWDKKITQIRSLTTYAQVQFAPPHDNSQGCQSSAASRRVAIDWHDNADRKLMYATAMLAYATNKKVGFTVNGCHESGVPTAVRIIVSD